MSNQRLLVIAYLSQRLAHPAWDSEPMLCKTAVSIPFRFLNAANVFHNVVGMGL